MKKEKGAFRLFNSSLISFTVTCLGFGDYPRVSVQRTRYIMFMQTQASPGGPLSVTSGLNISVLPAKLASPIGLLCKQ